jgi:hypothetical protein
MSDVAVEHELTVWLVNDIPSRIFYAGRRWRITDTPTRIRESIWTAPLQHHDGLYGWRFQATDERGESFVFDVYPTEYDWHVHRTYS